MARRESVIMTAAEKKAAVKETRIDARTAKAELKELSRARKELDKQYKLDVAALEAEYRDKVAEFDVKLGELTRASTDSEIRLMELTGVIPEPEETPTDE